jgi:CBS domain containing-hemolysin-like protein
MSTTDHEPGRGASRPSRPGLFDRLRALFGLNGASVREDIEDALEDSSTQADFTPQERLLLKNVLSLHEVRVQDVMVPRADIISVSIDATLSDILSVFRTAGHSRLPVYGETLDDPRGMIHIRDFVDYVARAAESGRGRTRTPVSQEARAAQTDLVKLAGLSGLDLTLPLAKADILRPVLFVPPSMPALDLLVKMQASRTHMALVIDEYGGTDGIASIEDIVEMIVGDIEDEHDLDESPKIEGSPDGSFIVDARANLQDVSEAMGEGIIADVDLEEVDTIGGLVSAVAGRVPVRGEIVRLDETFEVEILDADPRRVKRLRLRKRAAEPAQVLADPASKTAAG